MKWPANPPRGTQKMKSAEALMPDGVGGGYAKSPTANARGCQLRPRLGIELSTYVETGCSPVWPCENENKTHGVI
jgi:hypothetical protein